jgi:hypothetical protein
MTDSKYAAAVERGCDGLTNGTGLDANGEIFHEIFHGGRACVDCVAYLANGEGPED